MNRTTIYGALAFIVLSWLIYVSDSPERILGTSSALQNEVDAIPFAVVQGTTTTHFEKSGNISYTFNAARLEHYRDEDDSNQIFTLVEVPELIIYQEDQPWFVRADKGKIYSANQHIELWSEVRVEHTNEQGITTNIFTEQLNIDPVNKLAKTEEPVKITSDRVEIKGTGMTANLAEQNLRLLSEVQALYDPK